MKAEIRSKDILGALAVGINEMVGNLRRMNEEQIRKAKILERAKNNMEEMMYAVSHDLRNPLRTIISFSQFLMEDYGDVLDERAKDYILRVIKAGKKIFTFLDAVSQLLYLERIPLTYKRISVKRAVQQVIKNLDTHRRIKIKYPSRTFFIKADPERMKMVFYHLLKNAVQYNDKEEVEIEIGGKVKRDFYEIWIKDNGPGIPKYAIPKIFKIFRKLHHPKEDEGPGVGLTIVREIIQEHEGEIRVESEPKKGSIFYLRIKKI